MSRLHRVFKVGALVVALALATPQARTADQAGTSSAGTTITGSVVDGALTPLAGVVVTFEQNGRVVFTATTDAKGLYRLAGVGPGAYRVRAEKAGLPVFTRELNVASGASSLVLPIVLALPQQQEAKVADLQRQSQFVTSTAGGVAAAALPPPAAARVAGAGGGGGRGGGASQAQVSRAESIGWPDYRYPRYYPETGETYAAIDPNRFHSTRERPLSTFGADVDTAGYSNVRRFLNDGQLPPRDAVRVEELINYFRFDYAAPRGGRPISLTTEVGPCPWAPTHKLVLIGARAAAPAAREIAGRNIVLLIDVSGSMAPTERLPMIKTALGMFVDTLRPDDTLAIVTYAGTSGVALYPTPARRRDVIQASIARLNASGSTNGAQGLITAYRIARESYIPGGVNRVILATDGDFNVGITSQGDLRDLIERERDSGVFLSVFGVGSGNLKDRTMEMLADRGNGHYAYLDSLQEARRVLIREADATLETVAKDVKFQVEFNPAMVSAWKLIGYENRALAARDFNDDRKDAGDMGAGHTVTVLYEVIPAGAERGDELDPVRPAVDPLKYQPGERVVRPATAPSDPKSFAGEWMTVKARYKLPEDERSDLISVAVRETGRPAHLPLASALAEYGLLLRDAPRNTPRWDALAARVTRLTSAGERADLDGFRELVEIGRSLSRLK